MTIDQQIAELQKDVAVHSHKRDAAATQMLQAEQRIAELRARKEAERTVGERIAAHMVRDQAHCVQVHYYPGEIGVMDLKSPTLSADWVGTQLRSYIAEAIDKALADDRAAMPDIIAEAVRAEREACAIAVESILWAGTGGNVEWEGYCKARREAVAAINARS